MTTTPILDLLSDPNHWTKNAFARNSFDGQIELLSKSACKWCLAGAIGKCAIIYEDKTTRIYDKITNTIHMMYPKFPQFINIVKFNDDPSTTHADIIAVLKEAQV